MHHLLSPQASHLDLVDFQAMWVFVDLTTCTVHTALIVNTLFA
uniref:Uncharacterized protein n=1 Tax=Anguilla anguilla TaxID=7936 RepID=A0A0E9TA26_ANGAN